MTKTTTKSSRTTVVLSWVIALACFGAGAFFLQKMPAPQPGQLPPKDLQKQSAAARKATTERIKEEQAHRTLPAQYSKQLVEQTEVMAKKNLEEELKRFEQMSAQMNRRKEDMLARIEKRRLPASAPADGNDTSPARNIPHPGTLPPHPSAEDIYNQIRAYEAEIQQNHLAVTAAKQALARGLSFPETYRSLKGGASHMPSFQELVRRQAGGDWQTEGSSNASGGLAVKSTYDLNNYRGLMGQMGRQAGLAGSRLEGLFGAVRRVERGGTGAGIGQGNGQPGQGQPGGQPGGQGNGQGSGQGGSGLSGYGGEGQGSATDGNRRVVNRYAGQRLDPEMVKAQALPGRRFSHNAQRKGWLYINTWYMIGPWENYGREDFSIVHPPEVAVDFDAVYTDGQKGEGLMETDAHPIRQEGQKVWLDGTLRWKFMQSESMHNVVPVTTGHSTYYAYTELYFDQPATMLVAIGTDDSGRVWINGKDVWRDYGTSWYNIDEHIAPFRFRQGWNKILVRLENGGGGAAGFSFLILPQRK